MYILLNTLSSLSKKLKIKLMFNEMKKLKEREVLE